MPNWCKGELKIRGEAKSVLKFLKESIEGCNADFNKYGDIEVSSIGEQHIKRAGRTFCNSSLTEIYEFSLRCGKVIVSIPIIAAWRLEKDNLCELSKVFNVDFRFYGFEQGMQFNQELEIIKGKVTLENFIKFNDYDWECAFPRLGG